MLTALCICESLYSVSSAHNRLALLRSWRRLLTNPLLFPSLCCSFSFLFDIAQHWFFNPPLFSLDWLSHAMPTLPYITLILLWSRTVPNLYLLLGCQRQTPFSLHLLIYSAFLSLQFTSLIRLSRLHFQILFALALRSVEWGYSICCPPAQPLGSLQTSMALLSSQSDSTASVKAGLRALITVLHGPATWIDIMAYAFWSPNHLLNLKLDGTTRGVVARSAGQRGSHRHFGIRTPQAELIMWPDGLVVAISSMLDDVEAVWISIALPDPHDMRRWSVTRTEVSDFSGLWGIPSTFMPR